MQGYQYNKHYLIITTIASITGQAFEDALNSADLRVYVYNLGMELSEGRLCPAGSGPALVEQRWTAGAIVLIRRN